MAARTTFGDTAGDTAAPEQAEAQQGRFSIATAFVILTFAAFGIVGVAAAMDTDADCGPYGVAGPGGYGCADLTDAELLVSPSEDLVDRQTVTLTGTGFDPTGGLWAASQCLAETVAIDRAAACDTRSTTFTYTDSSGGVYATMQVRRIMDLGGVEHDCAEPGLCVIGAGTVTPDLNGAYEGVAIPISFDPDVAPIPPLEASFTVDDVTGTTMSGTITCSRTANFDIDASVNQQKAGEYASAYGYIYSGDNNCGPEATDWSVPLMPGNRRLTGGPADYEAYFYAYDGDDYAYGDEMGTTRISGSARPAGLVDAVDGELLSIEVVGMQGNRDDQEVLVQISCDAPFAFVQVSVELQQLAGLEYARAYGFTNSADCAGNQLVAVPFSSGSSSGTALAGGPAIASVNVSGWQLQDGSTRYDYASASGEVRLSGLAAVNAFEPEPNPESRITFDQLTRTEVFGTVECDGTEMVFLDASIHQASGRRASSSYAYSNNLQCDGPGPTNFVMEIGDDALKGGRAAIAAYAEGYEIVYNEDYGYFDYIYVWDDQQQAELRVRN